jgi:hypothetical protein
MSGMFDTATFLSVWYWVFTASTWSLISNWTFGVSVWALDRAKTSQDERALAATLVRRSIARAARRVEQPPLLHWAFQAFVLGAIATLAVLRENEISQGLLFLAVPMAGIEIWGRRAAVRLTRIELDDEALLRRIRRVRLIKQVVGGFSVAAAAAYGMWLHEGHITWYLGG